MNNDLYQALAKASSLSEEAKLLVDQVVQVSEVGELKEKIDELHATLYSLANPPVDETSVIEVLEQTLSLYSDEQLKTLPALFGSGYFKSVVNINMRRATARELLAFSEKKTLPLFPLWQDIYINGGML